MKVHRIVIEHIQHAHKINKLSHLIVLLSFLTTFVVTRIVVGLQNTNLLPTPQIQPHIHHLVPGIILLLVAGYLAIAFWENKKFHLYMSALFGIGSALTLDECALWFYLRDVYWEKGRFGFDAIVIVATLLFVTYVVGEVHASKRRAEKNEVF